MCIRPRYWVAGGQFLSEETDFSMSKKPQTQAGARGNRPAKYPMKRRCSFVPLANSDVTTGVGPIRIEGGVHWRATRPEPALPRLALVYGDVR